MLGPPTNRQSGAAEIENEGGSLRGQKPLRNRSIDLDTNSLEANPKTDANEFEMRNEPKQNDRNFDLRLDDAKDVSNIMLVDRNDTSCRMTTYNKFDRQRHLSTNQSSTQQKGKTQVTNDDIYRSLLNPSENKPESYASKSVGPNLVKKVVNDLEMKSKYVVKRKMIKISPNKNTYHGS